MSTRTVGSRNAQVVRQKGKKQQPKSVVEEKVEEKMPTKGGVMIGGDKDEEDKWKCPTCKRLTSSESSLCCFCGDPRPGPKKEEEREG
jgi:hypothetical protein